MNKKARSWNKLVQDARNDVSHIGGTDLTDAETTSDLDNIGLLAGQMDEEAQAEIQALYRKHVYGSEHGSMASSAGSVEAPKKSSGVMQTTSMAGLPSWRKVIEPHPDVAQGRYKNAEFAADLDQVARGEGAYEYRDPIEFFSRTYVTEGMKGLLVQALRPLYLRVGVPAEGMPCPLRQEPLTVRDQLVVDGGLLEDCIIRQPQQLDDVRVALGRQLQELA